MQAYTNSICQESRPLAGSRSEGLFQRKINVDASQLVSKLRILLADMRTWRIRSEWSDKPKLKNLLLSIHTQLNPLIEVQCDILNVMRQRVNYSSVFMKQLDSDEFENESEIVSRIPR